MAMPNQMTQLLMVISYLDESMHYLYNTPLLKYMEDWLDSYDIDLLTTGVLALGNFARTDSHCIEMVERNVTTKLLGTYTKTGSRSSTHIATQNTKIKLIEFYSILHVHSDTLKEQWR